MCCAMRNQPTEPWLQVAWAIRKRNQLHLEQPVDAARAAYSAIGYRIVIRGYTAFIQGSEEDGTHYACHRCSQL